MPSHPEGIFQGFVFVTVNFDTFAFILYLFKNIHVFMIYLNINCNGTHYSFLTFVVIEFA